MIRFDSVKKHFRRGGGVVKALDGVSLDVPKGALALIQGPSGSGKTTLVNLAGGLTRPSSGTVTVSGQDVSHLGASAVSRLRAHEVALVFQLFHLVPYLSARENVLLPTLAAPCANAGERADQLLDELGIAHRAGHRPTELSAGERQRCALARALLRRPQVVLADEPTGNLDEESAARVVDTLATCREEGATVLLVSHQHLDRIHADVEYRLKDGVLADGQ